MAIYFIPLFDAGNGLANFSMYSASFFAWSLPRNMMDTAPYDNNQQSNSYNLKFFFFSLLMVQHITTWNRLKNKIHKIIYLKHL